jgi:hypothetical protein
MRRCPPGSLAWVAFLVLPPRPPWNGQLSTASWGTRAVAGELSPVFEATYGGTV